jgi:hypothetical protein
VSKLAEGLILRTHTVFSVFVDYYSRVVNVLSESDYPGTIAVKDEVCRWN